MDLFIIFIISFGLLLVGTLAIFLVQRNQLREMNQNLSRFQEQVERGREVSNVLLRKEISDNLLLNRENLEKRFDLLNHSIESRLVSMGEGVQSKLEKNLKEGFLHFEKIQDHLRRAEGQLQNLSQVGASIQDLSQLLRLPHLRGGFGETTLERILSDTLPADAFELQYRVVPNSTERVDAIIRFPQFVIPIDSKFPRDQFLPLFEEVADNDKIQTARKQLCETIRILGRQIRDKYIHPEHGTSELALLFIPSETLYFEILRNPKLCEDLRSYHIFPVSPNTLTITVQAIALSRNYYEMARGVEETLEELRKMKNHSSHFETRFEDVGKHLTKALEVYHLAESHWNRYQKASDKLIENKEPSPPEIVV